MGRVATISSAGPNPVPRPSPSPDRGPRLQSQNRVLDLRPPDLLRPVADQRPRALAIRSRMVSGRPALMSTVGGRAELDGLFSVATSHAQWAASASLGATGPSVGALAGDGVGTGQGPVRALSPHGAHEPFPEGIGPERPDRRAGHCGFSGPEDVVEGASELRVAVADEVPHVPSSRRFASVVKPAGLLSFRDARTASGGQTALARAL